MSQCKLIDGTINVKDKNIQQRGIENPKGTHIYIVHLYIVLRRRNVDKPSEVSMSNFC